MFTFNVVNGGTFRAEIMLNVTKNIRKGTVTVSITDPDPKRPEKLDLDPYPDLKYLR